MKRYYILLIACYLLLVTTILHAQGFDPPVTDQIGRDGDISLIIYLKDEAENPIQGHQIKIQRYGFTMVDTTDSSGMVEFNNLSERMFTVSIDHYSIPYPDSMSVWLKPSDTTINIPETENPYTKTIFLPLKHTKRNTPYLCTDYIVMRVHTMSSFTDNVRIDYKDADNTPYSNNMQRVSPTLFEYTIDPQENGGEVEYLLLSTDGETTYTMLKPLTINVLPPDPVPIFVISKTQDSFAYGDLVTLEVQAFDEVSGLEYDMDDIIAEHNLYFTWSGNNDFIEDLSSPNREQSHIRTYRVRKNPTNDTESFNLFCKISSTTTIEDSITIDITVDKLLFDITPKETSLIYDQKETFIVNAYTATDSTMYNHILTRDALDWSLSNTIGVIDSVAGHPNRQTYHLNQNPDRNTINTLTCTITLDGIDIPPLESVINLWNLKFAIDPPHKSLLLGTDETFTIIPNVSDQVSDSDDIIESGLLRFEWSLSDSTVGFCETLAPHKRRYYVTVIPDSTSEVLLHCAIFLKDADTHLETVTARISVIDPDFRIDPERWQIRYGAPPKEFTVVPNDSTDVGTLLLDASYSWHLSADAKGVLSNPLSKITTYTLPDPEDNEPIGDYVDTLYCTITLENDQEIRLTPVHINIRRMKLKELRIEPDSLNISQNKGYEVGNLDSQGVTYEVRALADNRVVMRLDDKDDWQWKWTIDDDEGELTALDQGEWSYVWTPADSTKGKLYYKAEKVLYIPYQDKNLVHRVNLRVNVSYTHYDFDGSPEDPVSVSAQTNVDIYRLVRTGDPADEIYTEIGENKGFIMSLPNNMLTNRAGEAKIFVYNKKEKASPYQEIGMSTQAWSDIYETRIEPTNISYIPPEIIIIPRGGAPKDEIYIAHWDEKLLRWDSQSDKQTKVTYNSSDALKITLEKWGQYSIQADSKPLGLYDIRLVPNPFTPNSQYSERGVAGEGLRITFNISSDQTRYPKITCKIYNLQGTLVRTIKDNEPFEKGTYHGMDGVESHPPLYWDGYTDDKRLARNGRYIVHLTVEHAGAKKEYVKTVVLIK